MDRGNGNAAETAGAAQVGYLNARYAAAFEELGTPRYLASSGGWLLERAIDGSDHVDAMGLYPLFCCSNWQGLDADLSHDVPWVSLVLVTDPLGDYDTELLRRAFHQVVAFKEHYVADTRLPVEEYVTKSHRQNARRALRKVDVRRVEAPLQHLDEWTELYGHLVKRHDIRGMQAFSRRSFERQLSTPGIVAFAASREGRTIALDLWYEQGDVAQGHLVAMSDEAYALGTAYALKWTILDHFQDRVRWVNFGGLPGTSADTSSGLAHFKKGWSSTTRTAYLCTRVFDTDAYATLSAPATGRSEFFPAYRSKDRV